MDPAACEQGADDRGEGDGDQDGALHTNMNPGLPGITKEKGPSLSRRAFSKTPGGDLLSHTVSRAVPSALEGLTALFGMGRGVSPPP